MERLPKLSFKYSSPLRIKGRVQDKVIKRLLERDEPAIFEHSLDHWDIYKMFQKLHTDEEKCRYLEKIIGNRKVIFTETRPGGPVPFSKPYLRNAYETSFSDFVTVAKQYSKRGLIYYAEGLDLSFYPELVSRTSRFSAGKDFAKARLWIGFGKQVTNLHFDGFWNVISVVAGTKRVVLFPHESLPDLYPGPIDLGIVPSVPMSRIRVLKPDFKKFPRFKRALKKAVVAILKPGETLFIPPFWWHHVESFGFNVMINEWHFVLSPSTRDALLENMIRGVVLYDSVPLHWRGIYAQCFKAAVFRNGDGAVQSDEPRDKLHGLPEKLLRQIHSHFLEAAIIFQSVPAYLRVRLAADYEYFVFRVFGNPFPGLRKDADSAMTERFSKLLKTPINKLRLWGL